MTVSVLLMLTENEMGFFMCVKRFENTFYSDFLRLQILLK